MSAGAKEFVEEKVAFTADPKKPNRFIPRISVTKTVGMGSTGDRGNVEKSFRPFETEDVSRVLDFENVPDPPPDGPMMHCENETDFPSRHFALRGGFLFYFGLGDVSGTGRSHFVTYHGPPKGVIPLDKVKVEFPPGGRRVFREHAQTNARTGYELAILHADPNVERKRPPAFVVAESMTQRDKWAKAIMARSEIEGATKLRTGATFTAEDPSFLTKPAELLQHTIRQRALQKVDDSDRLLSSSAGKDSKHKSTRKGKRVSRKEKNKGEGEEIKSEEVVKEFGKKAFSAEKWIDNYFETHNELDSAARCKLMELEQEEVKRGLKKRVLEQYEYFVEASGEMTKMGREVVDLKTLVETQVETIKEMKEIDFSGAILDPAEDDNASDGGDLFQDSRRKSSRRKKAGRQDDDSDMSSVSSEDDESLRNVRNLATGFGTTPIQEKVTILLPPHLDDVEEEILAYVKESRYSEATELWAKTKQEVGDIMQQHEKPTDEKLTKKQFNQVQSLIEKMDELAEMISNRVVENLRRKNEALKQASRRKGSDASAYIAPSVSPCCLNDDHISLRLLVKLGKSQEAATAYSARRSLLLQESINERPLTGTGNVDLVIYAAQLSQSFFSCLAGAIEGFLDLFLFSMPASEKSSKNDERSYDENSINSNALTMRNLPAGALASIVLWCDVELARFATAFGGTRVLGNLALSPPPRDYSGNSRRGPRVLGQSGKNGNDGPMVGGNKDRQNAIEVAAQCVGQAFQYAAENLDVVGLPLSPRLAESLRKRLKGCEAEVAKLLDEQWRPIVLEWSIAMNEDEMPLDER
mmetsp:Transcript_34364/g.81000  ORF Transcript_34364/g.81000 Transcript_34364/m.81000 type:complete len:811 (-) Transcript_34364:1227-3659(-)